MIFGFMGAEKASFPVRFMAERLACRPAGSMSGGNVNSRRAGVGCRRRTVGDDHRDRAAVPWHLRVASHPCRAAAWSGDFGEP